ncbi:MAG: radical SAM protein [Candidatus Micrarchaeota archaeon]
MKINRAVFVNPYPYYAAGINEATAYPPLGLAYFASFLAKKGVKCRVIDANILAKSNESVLAEIEEFKPQLVGISTNVVTAQAGEELAKMIKQKDPKTIVVFGGPYATNVVEKLLNRSGADCIIRGEGEMTLLEFVKKGGNVSTIKGVSYLKKGRLISNPDAEKIQNLDELPYPAYDLLPPLSMYHSRSRYTPMAPMMMTRGCPYGCIFCSSAHTANNIMGAATRKRSPKNIVGEIRMLSKKYGVRQIDFLDDNFSQDMEYANKVMDAIIKADLGVVYNFQNGLRADRLDEPLIIKMKKAGVVKVGIGVESGEQAIVDAAKKSLNLEKVRTAIGLLRKHGIIVIGFFMLGLPGETAKTMEKTIRFALETNPHMANFSVVLPLPGTELYRMVEKADAFVKDDTTAGAMTGFYSQMFYYKMGEVTPELVFKYQKKAYNEFYFRPSKLLDLMTTIQSWNEFKWTLNSAKNIAAAIFKMPFGKAASAEH